MASVSRGILIQVMMMMFGNGMNQQMSIALFQNIRKNGLVRNGLKPKTIKEMSTVFGPGDQKKGAD